jgi:uncharacterized protein (DUF1015 family)
MPAVYPFAAIRYSLGPDLSNLVAPPYDVLDAASKKSLRDRDPRNIVAIDLPHTPAKELGPPEAYERAAETLRDYLSRGLLRRDDQPAMYVYRQTFRSTDSHSTICRTGMACCIETLPFGPRRGGGILPHEETFSGPKEDRMALLKATRTQLSPIFGLHADEAGRTSSLLAQLVASRSPDFTARTDDATLHEVWRITDPSSIRQYQDALAGEDVFIADGHHRYTTALNYLRSLETSGSVPPDHPARRCMIVLVGMSDPGLIIWPTHRVLGGMSGYTLDAFLKAAAPYVRTERVAGDLNALDQSLRSAHHLGERRFAMWDFQTGAGFLATPATDDPLADRFPQKPRAWRDLTVAFIQHVLVEQVCQPVLNDSRPVKWAFPHTIEEIRAIGHGSETGAGGGAGFAQLAVIVRPTPLQAVRNVSRAGELMPQKSTFFYPKLATGLFMNPLSPV